jgi:transposase-like protein
MTKPIERDPIYRGRRFQTETIELCVRWYITYRLSYRDLAAMMSERGTIVSHTTIMRWVLRYVPEYESRWDRYARPVNSSWRMDETAVSVRGGLHYLYRAVDKCGKSVGSLLRADRGMDAAQEFFRKAVAANGLRWPTTVNLDGNAASHRGLRLLGDEDARWKSVVVGSHLYFKFMEESGYEGNQYFRWRLAPANYHLTVKATDVLRSWIESGEIERVPLRIVEMGLDVEIEKTKHKQIRYHRVWSSMPPETHSIENNPKAMAAAAARACSTDHFEAGNALYVRTPALTQKSLMRGHELGRAAIKSVRSDLPVGVSLAILDDQTVGTNGLRDEKREYFYGEWLRLAREDDFLGIQNYG